MIVAQKWYCIAQTTSIGSSSGIKVEFGNYYRLLLNASVDWGNAVISIQSSNISKDIVASVRLRNNGQYFYLDIKLSEPFDTDFSTSLYDNSSWNLASSVSDLSGVPICIIDDINSLNTPQTGYFVEDENGDLHPIPKEDGTARGIYTDSYISSGGKNPNTEGGGGGGFTEFSVIFNGTQYDSSNGVATIDGTYATSDAVNNAIATSKSYTDTSIANLINGAPSTLDTLKEIADAFEESQDVIEALDDAIGSKANQSNVTTLQGYFSNGVANEAAKVSNTFKITFNGTTYEYNGSAGKEINFSAANIVSALGTTAVNRAKGDEDGTNIKAQFANTNTKIDNFITLFNKFFTLDETDGSENIKANFGLWTDSYLSAGGKNEEGGGGGGGLTEFSIIINGTTYNSENGIALVSEQLQPLITDTNKLAYSLISGTPNLGSLAYKSSLAASDIPDLSGSYLPLSGGTIDSTNGVPVIINTSNSTEVVLQLSQNEQLRAIVGYDIYNGSYIQNGINNRFMGIADDGTPYYHNGSYKDTLIHSGNIGSQAVQRAKYLDTLKVDGSGWYNNQYVVYGQWGSDNSNILDWKVDGYQVRVDRAKKLNSVRTIWGQSFNGTGDVSGDFYMQGEVVSLAGDLTGTDTNASSPKLWLGAFHPNTSTYTGSYIQAIGDSGYGNHTISFFTKRSNDYTTAPIERMRIASNGNVGIGTTDPQYKLDVSGPTRFMSVVTEFNDEINRYEGALHLQYRGSGGGSQGATGTGLITMCANGGNVLIGTTTDNGAKLQVTGGIHISRENFYGEYDEGIRIEGASSEWCGVFLGTSSEKKGYQDSQWYLLKTNTNTLRIGRGVASTSYLEVNEYGKIGVGKTNQKYELDVEGSIRTTTGNVRVHHTNPDMCLELLHTNSLYKWNYIRQVSNGYEWHIGINSELGASNNNGSDWLCRGAYEIRGNGGIEMNGIFIRYKTSNYGKLVVANSIEAETSIGYLNTKYSYYYPVWTVGTGIGDGGVTTFGWWFSNVGPKAWLTSSGNFYVTGGITAGGNITTSGRFYDSSDIRLKDIQSDLSDLSLDDILSIPRIRYSWKKDSSKIMIGTIAQPLIGKFDELLHKDSEGMYSVDYDSIGVIALEGVSKVKSEVDILKERIVVLEQQVKRLGGTV